jgi:ankyrin repeat protein
MALWAWPLRSAEVVRALVEWGADLRAKDNDGRTPLHTLMAVGREMKWSLQGLLEVVRALLEQGADVMVQDKRGSTLLHLAMDGVMVLSS